MGALHSENAHQHLRLSRLSARGGAPAPPDSPMHIDYF